MSAEEFKIMRGYTIQKTHFMQNFTGINVTKETLETLDFVFVKSESIAFSFYSQELYSNICMN